MDKLTPQPARSQGAMHEACCATILSPPEIDGMAHHAARGTSPKVEVIAEHLFDNQVCLLLIDFPPHHIRDGRFMAVKRPMSGTSRLGGWARGMASLAQMSLTRKYYCNQHSMTSTTSVTWGFAALFQNFSVTNSSK